jgi:DNA polymerase III delta prime subunit
MLTWLPIAKWGIMTEWSSKNYSKKSLKHNKSISTPGTSLKVCDQHYRSVAILFDSGDIVVIINEADTLTRDAQAALRRTMEKYMSNMRIILCANSTSKLIAPIKSRCLLVRVAAPTEEEVSHAGYMNIRELRSLCFLHHC